MLSGDGGKCGNLHGHTYHLELALQAEEISDKGMVVDFRELKRITEERILSHLDHAFLYCRLSAEEAEIARLLERQNLRTAAFDFRTTCENLAAYCYRELKKDLPQLASVRLWETADNSAMFSP